ncbi:MAG: HAMP domain-containing histidine kinase [Sphingomonadaceae bacterium]|nr:HAMP domain-containing histidine kinase [Sphingomonadaceae bacterium]
MHFDDRLGTVLRLSASGGAVRRIQFRQLLDLLGTSPAEARGEQLDAAFVRLTELAQTIPVAERAAMVRDSGLRLRSPRLVAALAEGEPAVAEAALLRAQLTADQWLDLIPALPPAPRPTLRQRRDLPGDVAALLARLGVTDRGLPPAGALDPQAAPESAPAEPPAEPPAETAEVIVLPARPAPAAQDGGIGAIVKRIEAYRRQRQVIDQVPAGDSPRLPLGEEHFLEVPEQVRAFDLACDAEGRVCWADPGIAPMVMGLRLVRAALSPDFTLQMRRHQPLRGERLELDGAEAISGQWQLDAVPWFDPVTGGYLGYRGRMRRPAERAPLVPPVRDSEADRIRQMLHELRTPVNAIQGFAEVIQQQLFGPTPHEYRALAANIAGDAARMLSAFEELERLARLDSGAMDLDEGEADLAAVLTTTVEQLGAHTAQRGSGFALKAESASLPVALARLEVERIVWRLLATLAGVAAPGEVLKLKLRERDGMARLDLNLPGVLGKLDGDDLFRAAAGAVPQVIAAGVFGVGFALRLARAEARAAGGDLVRKDGKLRLTLPALSRPAETGSGLTESLVNHRQGTRQDAG